MLSASLSRTLLNFMPGDPVLLGLTFLGILLVAVALAVTARALAVRFLSDYRDSDNSRDIVVVSAMVLTMFALLLAFAIVTLYDQRRDAETAVAREASSLAQISSTVEQPADSLRKSPKLPESTQSAPINVALVAYSNNVINYEFAAMHDGREVPNPGRSPDITNVFVVLQRSDPARRTWAPFRDAAVRQANDLVASRQARLTSTDAALPSAFVFLLFVAGGISVGLMCFVKATDAWVERGLVASVAVVITSGMLAAFVLEFPFSGPLAVSSDPICKVSLVIAPEIVEGQSCEPELRATRVNRTGARTPRRAVERTRPR